MDLIQLMILNKI